MAGGFIHGKNCRVYVDQFDLSRYFSEVQMQSKAELADTTTFASVAGVSVGKTVVPGVQDGTVTLKGLFDSTPSTPQANPPASGVDNYFYTLLANESGVGSALTPANVEACFSCAPEGSWAPGRRVIAMAGVDAQWQIQTPVKNAVMIQANLAADGGVGTGVSLKDPSVADATPGSNIVTLAAGSQNVALPQATITVTGNPTTAYPSSGQILVPLTGGGFATVAYTGTTATTFTGCTGGTGTTANSAAAVLPVYVSTGINDQGLIAGSTVTCTYGATPVNGASLNLTTTPFTFQTTQNPITQGFPSKGQFLVPTGGGNVTVTYSGTTTTSFTGCYVSSAATATASSTVTLPPLVWVSGAYAFLHVVNTPGGAVQVAKLQSSDDNVTWTDVTNASWTIGFVSQYGSGQYGSGQYGAGVGAQGGYILFIPPGTAIQRYVRVFIAYTSTTTAGNCLVTFVRI